jgi:hypothetical protein
LLDRSQGRLKAIADQRDVTLRRTVVMYIQATVG